MDISTLNYKECVVEILQPKTKEGLGIFVTLVSLEDDKMSALKREIINRNISLEKRNKNLKAEDIEENEFLILQNAITGWEWRDSDFHGEKPVLTPKNLRQVFKELPWFKRQIMEVIGDETRFLSD